MRGYCNTKGHSDKPHRKRKTCRDWIGVHATQVVMHSLDEYPLREEEETLPVISSEPIEEPNA